ncbi:MAG: hypothetical protein CMC15_14295, partial [Flavobacteriaceae bacterium]|nr:hypothetical protein [Flavobacteriaceae bacterium]
MEKYDLSDKRTAKESLANVQDLDWIKYGDTYVAGDDSIGEYIDQVFDTLVGDLSEANDAIEVLNKITKHLEKDPPERGEERQEWFDELETLTSQAGISLVDPADKAAIESDLGVITSPTVSFKYGQDWEKQIKDAVKEQEDQIFRDNVQTYNWFQKINQDESIDAVKEALYDMSPEGFVDAVKNSTKGFGKDTISGVKFENIADPQFAEFVYEQEGTSQLGLEVSRFIGKPPKPPEDPVDVAQPIKRVDARIAAQEREAEEQAIRDIDVDDISKSLAGTGVAGLVGADDSALVAQKELDEYQDIAGFAGMFGGEAPPVGSDVAD